MRTDHPERTGPGVVDEEPTMEIAGPEPVPLRGLPWPVTMLLSLAVATGGSLWDLRVSHTLGVPFDTAVVLGSLFAVVFTRRRALTAPMFGPPLVMIVAAAIGVFVEVRPRGEVSTIGLAIAVPVLPQFPVMAATTAATLLIGVFRLVRGRRRNRPAQPPA
ncbi:DUF6542 domain-containing protein [Amycolatopsis pigmentata]|uniref:DUF6542 domain-containing protein n=1 Tax=Amycolatopsis pigmentata TaxID=450801 RepID=A0ABW5FRS6_9PSEU